MNKFVKMHYKRFVFLLILSFIVIKTNAQFAISGKLLLGGIDFSQLSSNTSENGDGELAALRTGVLIGIEKYINSRAYSVKLRQGMFVDNHNIWNTLTQLNFRYRTYHRKHAMSFSVGPSMFAKWNGAEDEQYENAGNWQYKIQWLSGEVEYAYYLNSQMRAVVSLNHIEPNVIGIGAGVKFFFKSKAKSCNCPNFSKYK